jgi:5-formyltetrahydrofolate cyclo-ligase
VADAAGKAGWRARLLAARSGLSATELAAAAEATSRHVLGRLAGAATVAAYVPGRREPGSVELLDLLAAGGTEVLLPVVVGDGLDWAAYSGPDGLVRGSLGVLEPTGPRLGRAAAAGADALLVPALAVDLAGVRLGRGGGYYDRALALGRPAAAVVALLHDGELVPRLPADPWDSRVEAAVTPSSGWTELPAVEHHGG